MGHQRSFHYLAMCCAQSARGELKQRGCSFFNFILLFMSEVAFYHLVLCYDTDGVVFPFSVKGPSQVLQ